MKRIINTLFIISIILNSSCTVSKAVTEQKNKAQTAFNSGDYNTAFSEWEKVITSVETKGKKATVDVYSGAGKSALAIRNFEKGTTYLEQAYYSDMADEITLDSLASAYKYIDNLSKEINILERIIANHPSYNNIKNINHRLFDAYVRSENWETGLEFWDVVREDADNNIELMTNWFQILAGVGKEETANIWGHEIIALDKNNIVVLEYFAISYYTKGKTRYKSEMEAYDKKKTNRQYKRLLEQLKIASADFRTSRDYFEKLYKINPNPEYARYLGNIYSNLKNKEKAAYYKKLAKG